MLSSSRCFAYLLMCLVVPAAIAQTTAAPGTVVRVRGEVQAVTQSTLRVLDKSGEVIDLQLPATLTVSEVFPIALDSVQAGSYIGTAALPQADGTQRALAITVFPESARGAGEGHRPFDLMPQSTMTNATVAQVVADASGRRLQVRFKDGEKTIAVPADVPIVSFRPATRALLVPGASVSLTAQEVDGKPTALRINAGKDGFKLPY